MDKRNSTIKDEDRTFLFGKRAIENLPIQEPGTRKVYSDTKTPHLFLRVTPKSKTFFWQKTIKGSQKTVTIDKFPSISVEVARDRAGEIAADYTHGIDVMVESRKGTSGKTLGEVWIDFRHNRERGEGRISKSNDYIWDRHFKQWEKKPIADIDYSMARKLILEVRKTAPVHGNRVHRLGKALWNHGMKEVRLEIENHFTFA